MKHSEAKRAATRAKSMEQQEQNKSLMNMMRDEMADTMDEEPEPMSPGGYAVEEKDDYLFDDYAFHVRSNNVSIPKAISANMREAFHNGTP